MSSERGLANVNSEHRRASEGGTLSAPPPRGAPPVPRTRRAAAQLPPLLLSSHPCSPRSPAPPTLLPLPPSPLLFLLPPLLSFPSLSLGLSAAACRQKCGETLAVPVPLRLAAPPRPPRPPALPPSRGWHPSAQRLAVGHCPCAGLPRGPGGGHRRAAQGIAGTGIKGARQRAAGAGGTGTRGRGTGAAQAPGAEAQGAPAPGAEAQGAPARRGTDGYRQ